MKRKRHVIQVRDTTGKTLHTILRVPWAECIGNFNPLFCRYRRKRCLVHSDAGDLSDPFRRDETYLATLYITVTT